MIPFQVGGNTVTFTAATTPPTAVQCKSADNVQSQNYVLTNISSTTTAFVGWGSTAAEAEANAVVPTSARVYPLLPLSQATITAPVNAYFSGDTAADTAIVYVTPGIGA